MKLNINYDFYYLEICLKALSNKKLFLITCVKQTK